MSGQPTTAIPDLQRFAASILADSEGLAAALKILESCLTGPDVPLALIVQDLCSVPGLFEYIVSASPSAQGLALVRSVLNAYPADPTRVEASCAGMLLWRLSGVLLGLQSVGDVVRDRVGRSREYVEKALPLLARARSTNFSREDGEVALFGALGVEAPANASEAWRAARKMSGELKGMLQFYLELLLEPSLAQQFKDVYISADAGAALYTPVPQATEVIKVLEPEHAHADLKAVLCFEKANKFGEWRVIVSTKAIRRLREFANNDRKKCHDVVKTIRQLSKGRFSGENQERLNRSSGIPIFEAKVQRDLRLVYQIDVVPDHEGEVERQVIKIYGIYNRTPLNGIWDVIGQHLATKGETYRDRCILRTPIHVDSNIYHPACFPLLESSKNDMRQDSPVLSNEDMEELHSFLVLEKYATFSQAFLNSLIANKDVQQVFELAPQECRIVECTTSCYVLGRGGTGKTTTMLFKMLGIQWVREMQMSDLPKPRQIFVTKSHPLATKVQEYFTKLLESLELAGYSLEDLKTIHARSTESAVTDSENVDLIGIPQKYSELEDSHFPLFVTFDKLARMIAADVLSGDDPEQRHSARFFNDTKEARTQESFVTYKVFARSYWPHFSRPLTKGLEPWLVFSEFLGIIKGSEKSLSCPSGFLDEETYCNLSARSNPTFASQRRTVYAIFKAYCKLKKERRHHDVADRTHAILQTLMGGAPLRGQKVDYLYIDEAQDNLLIDAVLLRLICRNPNGLFWAGDTAQTISAGSSFRFEDLKAFLYRIERAQCMPMMQDRSFADPATFQLAVNYRSHGGIVNCAHTVIERITQFWPDSIDTLQPELGIVDGVKPWFFRDWNESTLKQFLSDKSGSCIELGAHQGILVRNDEAVEKLCKEVGEIGLIWTLYDSKGLEFDDVILYNFFEDSPVDVSRWRVLLNHLEGETYGQDLATINAPHFGRDESRFAGVCSELKLLYVGITRARKNLWILDKSDRSEPMRMVWTSRNQVQNYLPGMNAPHFGASSESSPEEWESRGHDLFEQQMYPQAMHCFGRASLPYMEAVCQAYHLRENACLQVGIAPAKAQQKAFLVAANAFVACGKDASLYRDRFQYYRNAANCYVRAGDDQKTATAYLCAEDYDLAVQYFRKAGLFGKTLQVLHEHSHQIPSESVEQLYTVCRLSYYRRRDTTRPRVPLFSSFKEELEFLQAYGLDLAQTLLLESHGRYLEAAELHLSGNRLFNAIGDLLKAKDSRDAIQKATKIILHGLWHRCSFGITPKEAAVNNDVRTLLKLASELPVDSLDPLHHDEISMFRAIAQADLSRLKELAHAFLKKERNAAALLALNHFFSRLPTLRSYSHGEMSTFLDEFWSYVRLLRYVISHPNPLSDNSIKQLFGITEVSSTEYVMEPGSFLHSAAASRDHCGRMTPRTSIIPLSKREMAAMLQRRLAAYLYERVIEENELSSSSVVFSRPCSAFIVNGQCGRADCPEEHVALVDLGTKWYNLRVNIHLQQIRILQLMYSVNRNKDRQSCVLSWLIRLYDALNPQSHVQGSTADLDLSTISTHGSLSALKEWVRDALYALRAGDYECPEFLANALMLTRLIFAFDRSSALRCITRAPFNAYQANVQGFMYANNRHVLEDIVRVFDGTLHTCVSAGLSFLRHLLEPGLFINLSVFCDFLEEVICKISVTFGLGFPLPLDGLILPRSWLGWNKDFSNRKDTNIVLVVDMLDHLRDRLIALQSNCDSSGRVHSLSGTELTPTLCNVYIARICRALSLLHYNVPNFEVRDKVESIFYALGTAGAMHELYRKYVQARGDQYLEVMVQYDADMKVVTKDLVQLLHKQRGPGRFPPSRLHRVQHVQFADPSEIPSLLAQLETAIAKEERNKDPEVDAVDDVHEESQERILSLDEPILSREHRPTLEEITAARKIKAAYRMYCKHREAQARAIGKGLKARRNAVFLECLTNVYAFRWERTPYRTLYLWALPHLMVCLDKAIFIARKFKNETRDLLLNCDHERLEVVGKKMSMICALLEQGQNLRRMVEPNATMHQAKDKARMRQAVLDVRDFVHRLPTPTLDAEIQENLHVAYELVVISKRRIPNRKGRR